MSITDNGTVSTDEQIGRPRKVQMITLIEKLTNLKYELLMVHFVRDDQFLSSVFMSAET
ncbi:hypothetical protein ES708_09559 [subsurface metagenome]